MKRMKRKLLVFLCIYFFILGVTRFCYAEQPDKVLLRYKYKQGEILKYKVNSSIISSSGVNRTTMVVTAEVLEIDNAGNAKLKVTVGNRNIESIEVENSYTFQQTPLIGIGETETIISPTGKNTGGDPLALMPQEQGKEVKTSELRALDGWLPEHSVTMGDAWEHRMEFIPLNGEKKIISVEHKVESFEKLKGFDCVVIKTPQFTLPVSIETPNYTIQGEQKVQETFYFAYDVGQVIKSEVQTEGNLLSRSPLGEELFTVTTTTTLELQ